MSRFRRAVLPLIVAAFAISGGFPASADTVIGVAGPLSGSLAAFGEQMRQGAARAIADLNANGGVNGEKLALQALDDLCDPKTADAVANQMAGRGAAMVVGHLCLGASMAAASVYSANHVIEISPGTTWPAYTDERPGPGIYRLAGRDDQQGAIAAAQIMRAFADRPVAIVDDTSPYGKELADATRRAMNAAGKREAFIVQYEPGQRDFTALVDRLQAANIGLVYIGGYPTEAGLIARQIREAGLDLTIMGGDALVTNEYRDVAGDAAEGTLITFAPDARDNPGAASVVSGFRNAGIEPEGFMLPAYAAVQAWAQAAAAAGSSGFDAVVAALDGQEFETVLGTVSFDDKGDMSLPGFVIYRWHDGRLQGPDTILGAR